jgi:hypothetical protein
VGSISKYSPTPPMTPAMTLFVLLLYNFFCMNLFYSDNKFTICVLTLSIFSIISNRAV